VGEPILEDLCGGSGYIFKRARRAGVMAVLLMRNELGMRRVARWHIRKRGF
jgi:hypothetical protein